MPYRLLRFGLSRKHPEPRMFTRDDVLKTGYEAVIIGAGGHGLAAAYYLVRDHGVRNTMRWRAEVDKHDGVRSEAVHAAFVKRGIPSIDMTCGGHAPGFPPLDHDPHGGGRGARGTAERGGRTW